MSCCEVGIKRGIAHEAANLSGERQFAGDVRHTSDAATHAAPGIFRLPGKTGAPLTQGLRHLIQIIAQTGNDAHPADNDTPHRHVSRSEILQIVLDRLLQLANKAVVVRMDIGYAVDHAVFHVDAVPIGQ